ncbi:membrane-bound ClpP family serine protease [Sporomusaceae bacterium BoRhaA]|uniref:DUF4405 domain-containing protein n=1 Tax=Pelorhabdus rhamnosifermentans TaxID=2772457 RepID=UPI001C06412E|nr:DUF4405 domain-containing protein [Pelorhabdus rhamnosifermentans]MBU2702250.1 membrane-bound ClpP family serine protease [Pelorhabdus rhamnosifermentans]
MLSKPERNYYLNIILLVLGTICVLTGIALAIKPPSLMPFLMSIHIKSLHEWTSYALTILVMFHLAFHLNWIKAMTKNKINKKNA